MRVGLSILVLAVSALAGCSGASQDDGALAGDPPFNTNTGCIRAVVIDAAVRPLAGATIAIPSLGRSAVTNGDGRADLCGLEPGSYLVNANRTGHTPAQSLVDVAAGEGIVTKMTLPLLEAASKPYHVTFPFRGYTDFSAGVLTPLLDPTLGEAGLTACTCSWDVVPDQAPAAITLEADWEDWAEDPTGPTEFIWQVVPEGAPGQADGQMAAPLVKHLSRIDFGDPGFSFANATLYHVSVYPDATWPAVGQEVNVYVTLWYLQKPPENWSFLAGDT